MNMCIRTYMYVHVYRILTPFPPLVCRWTTLDTPKLNPELKPQTSHQVATPKRGVRRHLTLGHRIGRQRGLGGHQPDQVAQILPWNMFDPPLQRGKLASATREMSQTPGLI
jgi:hypothetical protein